MAIRTLSAAVERDGVEVRTGHRVQRVVRDEGGRVVGVEATTADGATVRVGVAKAVVFATGGFTHDPELRQNFLNVPVYGGCAAASNEGDFVYIAGALGAQLRNMNYAWMCPVSLEKREARLQRAGPDLLPMGPGRGRVPLPGAGGHLGPAQPGPLGQRRVRPTDRPPGTDDAHVIRGDDLAALAAAIDDRLGRYADVTGGLRLADDFLPILQATVARFNDLAATGRDTDFGRGERAVDIPGLYGVGNCVASASAQAYWAGGATLGPILALAHRAARAAHAERVAEPQPVS